MTAQLKATELQARVSDWKTETCGTCDFQGKKAVGTDHYDMIVAACIKARKALTTGDDYE
jgi:hypothetical protein